MLRLRGEVLRTGPDMDNQEKTETFIRHLIQVQGLLYGYILAMLPNRTEADDVLQETNVVLWRKREEFEAGSNFSAWAHKVAYFEVCSHLKKRSRDRHQFNDALLDTLSQTGIEHAAMIPGYRRALAGCLEKLDEKHRQVVLDRYSGARPIEEIARSLKRTANSVYQLLHRIRATLHDCIKRRIAEDAA